MNRPEVADKVEISHPIIQVLDAILFSAISEKSEILQIYREGSSIFIKVDGRKSDAPPHQMTEPFMFASQIYSFLIHERQPSKFFRFEIQTAHNWKIYFISPNASRSAVEQDLNSIAQIADRIMWLADPQQ